MEIVSRSPVFKISRPTRAILSTTPRDDRSAISCLRKYAILACSARTKISLKTLRWWRLLSHLFFNIRVCASLFSGSCQYRRSAKNFSLQSDAKRRCCYIGNACGESSFRKELRFDIADCKTRHATTHTSVLRIRKSQKAPWITIIRCVLPKTRRGHEIFAHRSILNMICIGLCRHNIIMFDNPFPRNSKLRLQSSRVRLKVFDSSCFPISFGCN